MARKIKRIGSLPQLPGEILKHGSAAGGGGGGKFFNQRDDYSVRLSRALFDWKLALEALVDENNTGGTGTGTVTSITATTPIVVTPDPITTTGTVSHAASGVTATTYGDATHVAQFAVNATGHITSASNVAITGASGGQSSGEHLLMLGAIDAAQDAADSALGFVGATAFINGGGFLRSERLSGTSNWSVPTNVSAVWVTMVGGGGPGATAAANATPGAGGGAGEMLEGELMLVSGTVAYSVPTAASAGSDGGDTTFGIYTCRGGKKGSGTTGGAGGGGNGGAGGAVGSPGSVGAWGTSESALYFGGSGGGGAGNGTGANGGPGGGSGGNVTGGAAGTAGGGAGGGGGGAASLYGVGGAGGSAGAAGSAASSTKYGAGGGGGSGTAAGGNGAPGDILVSWVG